jgi:hypothetical protein
MANLRSQIDPGTDQRFLAHEIVDSVRVEDRDVRFIVPQC